MLQSSAVVTDTGALGGRVVGIITTRDHERVVRTPSVLLWARSSACQTATHQQRLMHQKRLRVLPNPTCFQQQRHCQSLTRTATVPLHSPSSPAAVSQGDRSTTVASVMTTDVVTGSYDESPEAWEEKLFRSKKGKLPLLDKEGKLRGLVTRAEARAKSAAPPPGAASLDANGADGTKPSRPSFFPSRALLGDCKHHRVPDRC